MNWKTWTCLSLVFTLGAPFMAQGDSPRVLAYVRQTPILEAQVDRLLAQQWGTNKQPSAKARQLALRIVIDQRLAATRLEKQVAGATDTKIEQAIEAWKDRLAERRQTVEEFLNESGLTWEVVRYEISWQVNWKLYLDKHLTESNVREYFEKHRRDFDGTQVEVSQIQWNLQDADTSADPLVSRLLEKAESIQQRIEAGELPFARAAKQFSESPSAELGGKLGWISRPGPMSEPFSRQAFMLEPGTMGITTSPHGIHLIYCEREKPGTRTFDEVRDKVRVAAKRYLFLRLAEQAKGDVRLETASAP